MYRDAECHAKEEEFEADSEEENLTLKCCMKYLKGAVKMARERRDGNKSEGYEKD